MGYHIDLLVEDIKCLVEHLGEKRFHMVAHDWGGAVGWSFAGRHGDMLKSYTACNIPHPAALQEARANTWEQKLKSWYILFFQAPILPELFNMMTDIGIFDAILREGN